eukprot:12667-Heterococcus_DN1.PRE.2
MQHSIKRDHAQMERDAKRDEWMMSQMQQQAERDRKNDEREARREAADRLREAELRDCKAAMITHSQNVMQQQAKLPAGILDATDQQHIDKKVRTKLSKTSDNVIKDYVRHLGGCFNTVTGETVWMPVMNNKYNPDADYFSSSSKKEPEVLVLLSVSGFLLYLINRFGHCDVKLVIDTVESIKKGFNKFFKTVALPDIDAELESMLMKTPLAYSLSQKQRWQGQSAFTDHSRKNFMLIDGDDFAKVLSFEPVTKHQKVPISNEQLEWDTLKLKRSVPPFHCSSTTADDSKLLPQFTRLTTEDKLVMPSFGVEWWSELLASEAYKKFFKIDADKLCHVQYGKVDSSIPVKDYTTVCNRQHIAATPAAVAVEAAHGAAVVAAAADASSQ